MGRILAVLAGLSLCAAAPAPPGGNASGGAALALAAIVGGYSPSVAAQQKSELAALFDGRLPPHAANITVKADKIVCLAGDVDITVHQCTLTFGSRTVALHGRAAHEIYATLVEAGVPSDGAAGKMYEALTALSCAITPADIGSGGGAQCNFNPGA
jgi:hypothetical protein